MQKKFDDFQSDLKANEVRLAEMNEIAMQLMTLGQTEAAVKIQTQLQVSICRPSMFCFPVTSCIKRSFLIPFPLHRI